MCGLVGIYSSNMFARHKDVLATLLYLDTFRGKDSTGVAAIRHNADTAIIKSTVPGYEFIEGPKLEQHLRFNDFCWIGHNRFGTIGRNIKMNAHPFDICDEDGSCILVGAHNGTLKNKHILVDNAKFGTDSEAMFNQIAQTSIEETIPLLDGAWAISYYDHVKEELRFIRNKERSLFYAYEEGKKTMIWASEMWMIRVACARHNVKLEDDKVYTFTEDTLYCFPAPEKMNDVLTVERKGGLEGKSANFFPAWRETGGGSNETSQSEAAAKSGSKRKTGASREVLIAEMERRRQERRITASGIQTNENGETPTTSKDGSSATPSKDSSAKVTSINKAKTFKGYGGLLLSKKEIEDQLENGCGWCEKEFITLEDKFAWLAPGKPICNLCIEGTHTPVAEAKAVSIH